MLYQTFDQAIWKNDYPRHTISDIRGRKVKHALEMLAALSICGPSTTREMARFTLSNDAGYEYRPVHERDARIREQVYYKLIHGRYSYRSGRKKGKKYPGLVEHGFLLEVANNASSGNRGRKYFLTLKGCFFALGFRFTDAEFTSFLRNASRNHMIFAYLNRIAEDTSTEYVREWFLVAIMHLIKKGLLNLDEYISLNNIFEAIRIEFANKIGLLCEMFFHSSIHDFSKHPEYIRLEKILKHTFFVEKPSSDWSNFVREYFYSTPKEQEFLEYSDAEYIEAGLLYRAMRSVHHGYFQGLTIYAPKQTQMIPHSREWKKFKMLNPMYKNPKDYDRKKHLVINY